MFAKQIIFDFQKEKNTPEAGIKEVKYEIQTIIRQQAIRFLYIIYVVLASSFLYQSNISVSPTLFLKYFKIQFRIRPDFRIQSLIGRS